MGTTSLREQATAEVRAEMARQKRSGSELASIIHCSQQSASRRLNGQGFTLDELPLIAAWLSVPVSELIFPRAVQGESA